MSSEYKDNIKLRDLLHVIQLHLLYYDGVNGFTISCFWGSRAQFHCIWQRWIKNQAFVSKLSKLWYPTTLVICACVSIVRWWVRVTHCCISDFPSLNNSALLIQSSFNFKIHKLLLTNTLQQIQKPVINCAFWWQSTVRPCSY